MIKKITDITVEDKKTLWVLCDDIPHIMKTSTFLFENKVKHAVLGIEDIPYMKYRCQVLGKSRYHILLEETLWRVPDFVLDITEGKEVLVEGHKYD
jgi:hypothetical protein